MALTRNVFIADVGAIPEGRTHTFRYGVHMGLAVNVRGEVKAYVNRCTHMGGPVELIGGKGVLRCRWHQAEFLPETGEAIAGEAPKGTRLTPIPIIVVEGKLYATLVVLDDPFSF